MQRGNLIFNIILLIGLAVLYVLHFSQDKTESVTEPVVRNITNDSGSSSTNIVFVDLQQLLVDYKFSEQLNIDFIKRKGSMQDQLDDQVRKYEKDATVFQEKLNRGNFLSQASAENQQKELLKRQQELQELSYQLEDKLMSEQQNMNILLYDSIINYLNEYNNTHKYQYILSKIDGSNLLVADSTLDITKEIIKVLNERYLENTEKE